MGIVSGGSGPSGDGWASGTMAARGLDPVDHGLDAPSGDDGDAALIGDDVWIADFMELHTCRDIGMGEGPIPWTAIRDYAADRGIAGPDRRAFETVIRHMDAAYLRDQAERRERERERAEARAGSAGPPRPPRRR